LFDREKFGFGLEKHEITVLAPSTPERGRTPEPNSYEDELSEYPKYLVRFELRAINQRIALSQKGSRGRLHSSRLCIGAI